MSDANKVGNALYAAVDGFETAEAHVLEAGNNFKAAFEAMLATFVAVLGPITGLPGYAEYCAARDAFSAAYAEKRGVKAESAQVAFSRVYGKCGYSEVPKSDNKKTASNRVAVEARRAELAEMDDAELSEGIAEARAEIKGHMVSGDLKAANDANKLAAELERETARRRDAIASKAKAQRLEALKNETSEQIAARKALGDFARMGDINTVCKLIASASIPVAAKLLKAA